MGACCSKDPEAYQLSEEEVVRRRQERAQAAEARAKTFKGGGGGESLKLKSKALEDAEKSNAERRAAGAIKSTDSCKNSNKGPINNKDNYNGNNDSSGSINNNVNNEDSSIITKNESGSQKSDSEKKVYEV